MSFRLGVDLGTTYSSAAVASGGKARIVPLGNRSAVMPSVVLARENGELLVGEAADQRGMAEPHRVAREFKRRIGDPKPFDLAGVSLRADQLMAALLPRILALTVEKEGAPPDLLALTHPASWGEAKRTMLRDSVGGLRDSIGGLGVELPPMMLVSEPEAAAVYYATTEHIDVGEVVAVYDLGGGTFDAAILRRTASGFDLMGPPEGIDRLGGVDFDAAVFAHINRFLDGALDRVDPDDPTMAAGLSRLRADCVEAKEALSVDTDVSIPVLLPDLRTELRMTRQELESMIRPALTDTIGALNRAMRAAHVVAGDVRVVLLVGGSSRIPLVAQMVGAEIGRPVAIDVHPKHAVALGAALAADVAFEQRSATLRSAPAAITANTVTASQSPPAAEPVASPAPAEAVTAGAAAPPAEAPQIPAAVGPDAAAVGTQPPGPQPPARSTEPPAVGGVGGSRRLGLFAAIGVLVIGVIAVALVLLPGGSSDNAGSSAASSVADATSTSTEQSVSSTVTPPSTATTAATTATTPTTPTSATVTSVTAPPVTTLPAECEGRPQPFVCIFSVTADADGNLIIPFKTFGYDANISSLHVHFFFPAYPEIAADPANAGTGGPAPAGHWKLWGAQPNPFGPGGSTKPYTVADAKDIGATEICVLVADSGHAVRPDTGNCLPIPAELLA